MGINALSQLRKKANMYPLIDAYFWQRFKDIQKIPIEINY